MTEFICNKIRLLYSLAWKVYFEGDVGEDGQVVAELIKIYDGDLEMYKK